MNLSVRLSGRLLYSISHSFPHSSNGYAVRTHGVATGLVKSGCSVVAIARPVKKTAWDSEGAIASLSRYVQDGVRYLHPEAPANMVDLLTELAYIHKPVAIMAASNWRNAQPALSAAKKVGLPFYYEVRGFWEISRLALDPSYRYTPEFADVVAKETLIARAADRVFTLNHWMMEELIRRGVDSKRISLVANGITPLLHPKKTNINKDALGLKARWVIGYVGSFTAYEGLELLVEACARLRTTGLDVALLLVGSGQAQGFSNENTHVCPQTEALRQLASDLGISSSVVLPGRATAEQVTAYYELIDAVVIPRRPLDVCELVTPVKPLEAASYGKSVLMADVAPLKDLADLYKGFGYFTKGCVDSLTQQLAVLLQAPAQRFSTTDLFEHCTWSKSVKPMSDAIQSLPGVPRPTRKIDVSKLADFV